MYRYIFGMSKSRKDLESWIEDHTLPVMCALAQLYVFPNSQYENHWRQEVYANFNTMRRFRHNNKLPSSEFIFNSSWEINKDSVKSALKWAKSKETELTPRKDISVENLYSLMESYFIWISEALSQEPLISSEEVYAELDELGL